MARPPRKDQLTMVPMEALRSADGKPGEVLLLENLRFYAEEEGKPRGLAEDATDEE